MHTHVEAPEHTASLGRIIAGDTGVIIASLGTLVFSGLQMGEAMLTDVLGVETSYLTQQFIDGWSAKSLLATITGMSLAIASRTYREKFIDEQGEENLGIVITRHDR